MASVSLLRPLGAMDLRRSGLELRGGCAGGESFERDWIGNTVASMNVFEVKIQSPEVIQIMGGVDVSQQHVRFFDDVPWASVARMATM